MKMRQWTRVTTIAILFVAFGVEVARAADPPYRLPVAVPRSVSSPPVDPAAPYTPLVRSLIRQLEPDSPPTLSELQNAAKLFQGGISGFTVQEPSCHGAGAVAAPTGTTPSIAPLCWA